MTKMAIKNLGIFILIATILAQATWVPAAKDAPLQSAPGPTHKVYTIGDDKGWCQNVDYEAWVTGKDFYMGDILVFNYTKGEHNVIKVDEIGYKECSMPLNPEAFEKGNDEVVLIQMGGVGFISSIGDDCKNGVKLFIPNVKCPHTRPKALQAGRKLVPAN